MTANKVALIVHTCDRYAFLYTGFQVFFEKNWDKAALCNYYFATEANPYAFGRFQNVQSGKGEWADRLALLLREKIAEKYILYFQEDMWLNKPTNAAFFNKLFELAENNNWQQVKLHSSHAYVTRPGDVFIEGLNIAAIDNAQSKFLMSHQVTLWNKDFLLAQLHKNEHPWRNERKGSKRLKKLDPPILQADYFAANGQPANNPNQQNAQRCSYYTISVNGTLDHSVRPYIDSLINENSTEADRQYGLQLQHHYRHQLTHDGLTRPRKTDIFKRIKNRLLGK